jgi:signal transduction histidine kinase
VLNGAAAVLPLVLGLFAAAAAGALGAWLLLRRQAPPRSSAPPVPSALEDAEFGTLVSHDLRAPIRVVEGFTRIVKEDHGAVIGRVGVDHLDRVLGAATRMNHMIDALLALSRLSAQPLAMAPVDLSQLAGYVVEDLRRLSPERRVEVEIEPGLTVSGDPTLLRMVLENLLGNAWKYTGNTEVARIAFLRHPKEPSTFTVRDNGAGFDMRFADRLFGAFQRLHSASEFPGTGIGLASVRRIVHRHGGEIRAEGVPERGASFHFSLPG